MLAAVLVLARRPLDDRRADGSAELTVNTPSGDLATTLQANVAGTNSATGVLTVEVTLRNVEKMLRLVIFGCIKAGSSGAVPGQ